MFEIFSKIFKKPKKKTMKLRDLETVPNQMRGFKAPGYSAKILKEKGFPAWAVKDAGYSIIDMKEAGYSARALKNAGFSKDNIDATFK